MTDNRQDFIFVKNLEVDCYIGANPGERDNRQCLRFSFEIPAPVSKAAQNDDLNQAINYWKVSQRLIEIASGTSFKLLETLADRLATQLVREFNLPGFTLTIEKPDAYPGAAFSGITVTR